MGVLTTSISRPELEAHSNAKSADAKAADEDTWDFQTDFGSDVIAAMKLGVPLLIGGSSRVIQALTLAILLGRKETVLLAAVASASIWAEPWDQLVRTSAGQVSVLAAQAYGAGKFSLVGTWCQMALITATLGSLPLMALKAMTGPCLSFLGVQASISEPAGQYAIYSSFSMTFELWYFALWSFFIAQGIVGPDTVISMVFVGIALFLVWLGISYFNMGVIGVAWAISVKRALRFAALVTSCYAMGYFTKCWPTPRASDVFSKDRWILLMSQVLPVAIGAVLEKLVWSINAALAARLGAEQAAAYDLLVQLMTLIFTMLWGLSQGFGLIMANRLGANLPNRAAGVAKAGVIVIEIFAFVIAMSFHFGIERYADFASLDPGVRRSLSTVRFIGIFALLGAGGLYIMNEILAKQGRAALVFISVPPFSWGVGIPVSFFLTPQYGIWGTVFGTTIAYSLAHVVCGYHVFSSDWQALALQVRACAEVSAEGGQTDDTDENTRGELTKGDS